MKSLTIEEIKKLNNNLNNLKYISLPKILKELSKARELGDLSENAEYIYAKKKKNLIENKIKELEEIISKSKIINNKNNFKKIILKNLKNNKIFEYNIDINEEKNEFNYKILELTENKKIGEKFKIKKFNKIIEFEIISK